MSGASFEGCRRAHILRAVEIAPVAPHSPQLGATGTMSIAISSIIASLVSAVIGAVVSAIMTRARVATSHQRALEEGVRELLMAELYEIFDEYVLGDKPIPIYVRDIAAGCYACYHDGLGGNGTGTYMHEKICEQPIEGGHHVAAHDGVAESRARESA